MVVCFSYFAFFQTLLSCASHPPASPRLSHSRNFSGKLKSRRFRCSRLPPSACAMGVARGSVRVVRARALARGGGSLSQ